jgi:hypothetical protein
MGSDTILIEYSTIQLISKEEQVIAKAVDGHQAGFPCSRSIMHRASKSSGLYYIAMLGVLFPPLLLGLMIALPISLNADATDQSAALSMKSKDLGNRSIANGQRHSGFVYFLLNKEEVAALRNVAALRMNVKNLETKEEIPFSFGINLDLLSKRITELSLAE